MKILEWIGEHVTEIIVAVIMILVTGIVALLIIASVKNENNRISEGTVIDKDYHDAYTSVYFTRVNNMSVPHYIHHPESYKLQIQGEKDEEIVTYWFECTAEEYQQYKIGDYYMK